MCLLSCLIRLGLSGLIKFKRVSAVPVRASTEALFFNGQTVEMRFAANYKMFISRFILFHRANLRIAVPSEQRFFALVPIDLLHIADIQIMVA